MCADIHLIIKRLSSELLHCALRHCCIPRPQCTMGVTNLYIVCMPRPQSIVVHIASLANTRIPLSHSRYLQCYLKIRCIHGALRLGMQQRAMCNATIQKTAFFELGVYHSLDQRFQIGISNWTFLFFHRVLQMNENVAWWAYLVYVWFVEIVRN